MSRYTFGATGALLAVLAAALIFFGSSTSTQAVVGGPVVLMGIDAEDGGVGGHGPISVYDTIVTSMMTNVVNGGSGILVVGAGKDVSDDVTAFWDQIATDTGNGVTYVTGDAAIAAQSFDGFAMIAVVSGEEETSSGGLTQAENDALAARVGDVAAFINNGGGLLGFSQSGMTNPYAYIGGIGSFTVNIDLGYALIAPTAEGTALGITDDLDLCCWHDTYEVFPDFLQVLATQDDSEELFFGQAAAIGGAQVIVLPEGPFGDPTCSDQVDNDADELIDAADPDCAPPVTPTPTAAPATATPSPSPTAKAAAALPNTGGAPGATSSAALTIGIMLIGLAAATVAAGAYSASRSRK